MKLWERADEALLSIRARKATMAAEELRWLVVAWREKAHRETGLGTFHNYIRNRLGVGKRAAFDYQRVAIRIVDLPRILAALEDARLTYSGVRELTRVATPETEMLWLARSVGQPPDVIEDLVSGRIPGDTPDTPRRPEEVVKNRTFEVRGETDALLGQAKLLYEKQLGRSISDDELFAELARGKISDVAAASERKPIDTKVVMMVCEDCKAAKQLGRGKWSRIDPSAFDDLDFDPVLVIPSSAQLGTDTEEIPAWVRREVYIRDGGACRVPGCASKHNLHCHHILWREFGGPHEPWNLLTICSGHHSAIHRGNLLTIGSKQDAIEFQHADGTPYGSLPALPART